MKKYYSMILGVVAVFSFFAFNGCILDNLNTIDVKMPYTAHIDVSGSQNSITKSETFDISTSSIYDTYSDKINGITFVKAQFRTSSYSDAAISGNITITLKDNKSGIVIFSKTLTNVKPADYKDNPLQLNLTQTQINLFNSYLKITGNTKYTATVSVDNISGGSTPRSIGVDIDVAFNIDANT